MKSDFQIGKNGIGENFFDSLATFFKTHRTGRISILSSGPRDEKKKISEEILSKLGKKYSVKIIGFVLVVTKWRQDRA